MIKYLLTKLGRAGWENIWLSVKAHGPRCTDGPYAMISSQIFSQPALPLSQLKALLIPSFFIKRFVFGTECKIIGPKTKNRPKPKPKGTKSQQDCKLHDCRNTEPRYNGDEDPEPENTARGKKTRRYNSGDLNS